MSGTSSTYVTFILRRRVPKKKLCTLSFCNFHLIKKEIPFGKPRYRPLPESPFYFLFFTLPPRNAQGLGLG
jgi:hypothetical protein